MKYIDADQIRAEIERLISISKVENGFPIGYVWKNEAYKELLSFLDTLPEQPVLPGIDESGIPGKDYIPVEWVDACEKYGKWKIVQQEQPEVDLKKEMDEEIERFYRTDEYRIADTLGRGFETLARHFYELGRKAKEDK